MVVIRHVASYFHRNNETHGGPNKHNFENGTSDREHNFVAVFCFFTCSKAQIHQLHEVFLIALGAAPASHVFVVMF